MRWTLLLVLGGSVAHMGMAQVPGRLELVRCAAGADVPCLRARVTLAAYARAAVGQLDSGRESAAWRGELAGNPLVGPGLAAPSASVLRTRLLILIDRGPTMSGEGIAFTRIALKSWLATLDTATIRVALAGFDGRDLPRQILAATFQSPRTVLAALDSLPAPAPRGHSPLYSAILDGAQRVAAASDSVPGINGGLLVITMGRNDVGRGKDAEDFLAGDVGLGRASAGMDAAGKRAWIVALGTDAPMDELGKLAGAAGSAYAVALDPNAIALRLAAIAREFVSARELTFGVGAIGTAALGRAAMTGSATLRVGTNLAASAPLAWRPPLIAMPTFQAVAEPSALSPELREALLLGAGGGSNRPIVALLMAALVGGVWVLASRMGWRGLLVVVPAARERATTTRTVAASAGTEEGPPRKPDDITNQTARRTALRR